MTPEEARALVEKIISWSSADDITVTISGGHNANVRFAANQVTTAGAIERVDVSIECAFGKKHGSAQVNLLEEEALKATLKTAEESAKLAPEDPEFMGSVEPSSQPLLVERKLPELSYQDRAGIVSDVLSASRKVSKDLVTSGFLDTRGTFLAVGNKLGLFAYGKSGAGSLTTTVRTKDGSGSGWAGRGGRSAEDLDPATLGRRAADKAQTSQSPRDLAPGKYPVVLEPACVADLLRMYAGMLNARATDEGRSAFSLGEGKSLLGQKVASRHMTLYSDPGEERLLGLPFDGEGMPLQRQVWIEGGVLKKLAISRYWAKKTGKEPTGGISTLAMKGGTKSLEALIRGLDKGLLVTRFFYTNFVDPKTITVTGLTRDGLFWVEKGKIAYPVKNFRFNQSLLSLFQNIEEISTEEVVPSGWGGGVTVAPGIRASSFQFSSPSDAV